jgi:hypothetical protein
LPLPLLLLFPFLPRRAGEEEEEEEEEEAAAWLGSSSASGTYPFIMIAFGAQWKLFMMFMVIVDRCWFIICPLASLTTITMGGVLFMMRLETFRLEGPPCPPEGPGGGPDPGLCCAEPLVSGCGGGSVV